MYVHDQPRFINGACLISTSLDPQTLINLLKDAEDYQGRVPTIQNGPRVVDLDVLFDGNRVYDINDIPERSLNVPHPRLQEREFVLRPLADMIPSFQHPILKSTMSHLLTRLPAPDPSLRRIINFPAPKVPQSANFKPIDPVIWRLGEKTHIMATLNTTPDSFSDGGQNNTLPTAVRYSLQSVAEGADMIDVGGFSTRPGSSTVSTEEESERTAPYIIAMREARLQVPISVDTFRAVVAERCIEAGANCINDVYALTGPHVGVAGTREADIVRDNDRAGLGMGVSDGGAMLNLAVRSKIPVLLMHSRGPANAHKDYSSFGEQGVIEAVRSELELRVGRALNAGVRRWNIILDPGIGFSKSLEDNLRLIRGHAQLTRANGGNGTNLDWPVEHTLPESPLVNLQGFGTLVGTSRKAYLGNVLGRPEALKDAREREWGTAAAVVALVQQGVDIVRVHSVQAMRDVLNVADAIWRSR